MRKLIVSEFVSLDGVMQAPGGADEDSEGGFRARRLDPRRTGTTTSAMPSARSCRTSTHSCSGGRRTSSTPNAFEPMTPGDVFGDMMNAPAKYVVSRTLEKPIWRNTTIIRGRRRRGGARSSRQRPARASSPTAASQLVHTLLAHDLVDELHLLLYPLALGGGKRLLPEGVHRTFKLNSATPYPSGVVGLLYERVR